MEGQRQQGGVTAGTATDGSYVMPTATPASTRYEMMATEAEAINLRDRLGAIRAEALVR
jgi:hypothetical protein